MSASIKFSTDPLLNPIKKTSRGILDAMQEVQQKSRTTPIPESIEAVRGVPVESFLYPASKYYQARVVGRMCGTRPRWSMRTASRTAALTVAEEWYIGLLLKQAKGETLVESPNFKTVAETGDLVGRCLLPQAASIGALLSPQLPALESAFAEAQQLAGRRQSSAAQHRLVDQRAHRGALRQGTHTSSAAHNARFFLENQQRRGFRQCRSLRARFYSPPIIRAACRRQRRWVRRALADIPPRRSHPPTAASPAARR